MIMRFLLVVLVPPILLLLCAVLLLWIPLPQPFPPALSAGRNRLSAVVTGTLGLGYLIALAFYVISSFLEASRVLAPVLTPLGLLSESYNLFGRRYRGQIQGREVEVSIMPGYGVSRALLNVYVTADIGTRVAIGPSRPLLDCRDCPRLEMEDPALGLGEISRLEVYAQVEASARRLLSDPSAKEALARLMPEEGVPGTWEIYIQPERVWLRARPQQMATQQFQQLLDDLLSLAGAAEVAMRNTRR
jgi:hypothetical protein